MKTLISALVVFTSALTYGQGSRFQFEPYIGLQCYEHVHCQLEDPSIHQGATGSFGYRFIVDLNSRFSLIGNFASQNVVGLTIAYQHERLARLNCRYRIGHFKGLEWLDFNVESGVGYSFRDEKIKIPFYLGTQVHLSPMLDLNMRFNPPSFMNLTDKVGSFNYTSYKAEVGLAMRFCQAPPKLIGRAGNPFILQ